MRRRLRSVKVLGKPPLQRQPGKHFIRHSDNSHEHHRVGIVYHSWSDYPVHGRSPGKKIASKKEKIKHVGKEPGQENKAYAHGRVIIYFKKIEIQSNSDHDVDNFSKCKFDRTFFQSKPCKRNGYRC